MTSPLDGFFKFKIGDSVRLKAHRPGFTARGTEYVPQEMTVVERYLVECYGGIQANYRLRVHQNGYGSYAFMPELIMIVEVELTEHAHTALLAERPPRPAPQPTPGDDNAPI